MQILVLNCGSSSVKAAVLSMPDGHILLEVMVERIHQAPVCQFSDGSTLSDLPTGHEAALKVLLPAILQKLPVGQLDGIGHRVVHGGEYFDRATRITPSVIERIASLNELAPLHNPVNVVGIQIAQEIFPELLHVAVFDTAFHRTLPKRAQLYALPIELTEKYQLKRYGFHGTSHEYVAKQAAKAMGMDLRDLKLIACHLGGGCSISAIEYGRSVETSMGMTPLEGLVMGTRPGDLDPGILMFLQEKEGWSVEELNEVLNKKSGLKGLSGASSDMRDILDRAAQGDEHARMAIQVFTHRVRKYIGAYAAMMGGVDGIIFTGGIGE
ncbi:MAG: acetate/propionate family kinase, partial [Phaeodactylibacter sp.]|nr:acetate/propionate family kinase [Phaeodactylibacter sp.]